MKNPSNPRTTKNHPVDILVHFDDDAPVLIDTVYYKSSIESTLEVYIYI